jgi:phosphoglucosamine mutase
MKLFGTDGIRGRVNINPMTPETVLKVGVAAARVLHGKEQGRNMVLIGKDTRLSGYMVESALTSGICSSGMNVTLLGPIPTPGVAFLTRALRADAGIVISASHNPYHDNGIKIFSHDGFKLPDEMEQQIEDLVKSPSLFRKHRPHGADLGKAYRLEDGSGRYIEYIKSTIPKGMTLEGLKVVVDCANGAAYKVSPAVLTELGAEVVVINDAPDGVNINHECGSLHLDALARAVKAHKAHIGVAHDGDADRTLFVDEKGREVNGDLVLGIWAAEMQAEGRLNGSTVVSTVMSNLGLEHFLARREIRLVRTKVGDRFVTERMRRDGHNLGGEQSGHIIFFDYNTTGDGPITALHVVYLMKKRGMSLSDLTREIEIYPQVLVNVEVQNRAGWSTDPAITEAVKQGEREMAGTGRVLVRASGTEPKIRVMVEGEDDGLINRVAGDIVQVVKDRLA